MSTVFSAHAVPAGGSLRLPEAIPAPGAAHRHHEVVR